MTVYVMILMPVLRIVVNRLLVVLIFKKIVMTTMIVLMIIVTLPLGACIDPMMKDV
jgi:hypothetical protein